MEMLAGGVLSLIAKTLGKQSSIQSGLPRELQDVQGYSETLSKINKNKIASRMRA